MRCRKDSKIGGTGFPACVQQNEFLITRRNLPHWQLTGSTYFITFRVKKGLLLDHEKQIVLEAIRYFHQKRYWVTAAVVMPDHVHLLIQPWEDSSGEKFSLAKIIQSIKGFSAREINKIRGQRGAL